MCSLLQLGRHVSSFVNILSTRSQTGQPAVSAGNQIVEPAEATDMDMDVAQPLGYVGAEEEAAVARVLLELACK